MLMCLIFFTTFSLLALSTASGHHPEGETHFLARRNPCDGLDYPQTTLYEDYTEPLCPAPKHLDNQGASDHDVCVGPESPFFRSECHYPMCCELRETDSTQWSVDGYISGNAQFQKAIDAGITGGIGSSSGQAKGHSWTITPSPGECGYFTWIPVVKRTCGTVTSSLKIGTPEDGLKCLNKTTSIQDVCHDQVWSLEDHPDGVVIWVRTNCTFKMPLGSEYQDPVYNSPGVSLYDFSGISMFDGWSNNTCVINVLKAVSDGTWFELQIKARGLDIRGIGNDGEVLHHRVNACGDIVTWNFTWADTVYPSSTWDMGATSTMFVKKGVQKACIGTAMEQADGVKDECV